VADGRLDCECLGARAQHCGQASFAVVANPHVLFERASLERLFGSRAPEAIAFGLLATLGIVCAIAAVGAWLLDPFLPD
jgi:hypothetical protein